MELLLVLLLATLIMVLIVLAVKYKRLAVKYNKKQEEFHNLELHVQDRANEQYHVWVDAESQHIRTQQLNLARREAAAALEEWKSTSELSIRNDAIQRSQSVILGKVTEHLVPYLPTFTFNPKDARFIGSPIDILVFDGMDEGELREIVFIEVKTGPTAALTKRERQIRDAVRTGRIQWREVRVERIVT
jgi:predicted Holliday junction resolvase-like endonuclease